MKKTLLRMTAVISILGLNSLGCQSITHLVGTSLDQTAESTSESTSDSTTSPAIGFTTEETHDGTPSALATPSPAGFSQAFTLLSQTGGSAFAVAGREQVIFLGQGPRIVALDVSHPASPQILEESEVLPGLVLGFYLSDQYLYAVLLYGGLQILDVSDPAHMIRIGSIQTDPGGCNSITVENETAYLGCNAGGLWVVDVHSPDSPQILSHFKTGLPISLAKKGDYVYLSDVQNHNLRIVNVSDPTSPQDAGTFDLMEIPDSILEGTITSIKTCGTGLCLAVEPNGLVLLNLSDPENPQFQGMVPSTSLTGMATDGTLVYMADDLDGIKLVDISNPAKPVEAGILPIDIEGWELSVEEFQERGMLLLNQYLYVTDPTYGLTIVDIQNPAAPQRIGQYMTPLPNWLLAIDVEEDRAYIGGRHSGIRVVDISNPQSPREIAYDDSRKNLNLQTPSGLIVWDSLIYVSDENYPFHILDARSDIGLKEIGAIYDSSAPDGGTDLVLSGNIVYLAGNGAKDAFYPGHGIWVIDVSNPHSPKAAGYVPVANKVDLLELGNGYLFALGETVDEIEQQPVSLRVFSLENPLKPEEVVSLPIPLERHEVRDLRIDGNRLLISTPLDGILVYDISLPTQPTQVAVLPIQLSGSPKLTVSGQNLYVSGKMRIDIQDVHSPQRTGVVDLMAAWDCYPAGDLLYVITMMQGLYIYQISP